MSDPSPWSREGSAAEPDVIVVPAPGTWPPPPEPAVVPPPPGRRRGKWIAIGAVAFVALVLVGSALGLALSSLNKHNGPFRHTGPASLTAPETIGQYTKQNQAATELVTDAMGKNGAQHPFAVVYMDDHGHMLLVWGGTDERYRTGQPASHLDEVLSGIEVLGIDPSALVDVDPGPTGGAARCGPSNGTGWTGVVCGWSGSGAVLGLMFSGAGLSTARADLPALLSALVTY